MSYQLLCFGMGKGQSKQKLILSDNLILASHLTTLVTIFMGRYSVVISGASQKVMGKKRDHNIHHRNAKIQTSRHPTGDTYRS